MAASGSSTRQSFAQAAGAPGWEFGVLVGLLEVLVDDRVWGVGCWGAVLGSCCWRACSMVIRFPVRSQWAIRAGRANPRLRDVLGSG